MNQLRKFRVSALVLACGCGLWLPLSAAAESAGTPRTSGLQDCTDSAVDYTDEALLSQSERLARMDRALSDSLDKFDRCQTRDDNSDDGSGGGGQNAGSGAGDGLAGDGTAGESAAGNEPASAVTSTASPDISGTRLPATVPASDSPPPAAATGHPQNQQDLAAANGKAPEDIPPVDNDSLLEAQIRRAAEQETDPETRARLWNEYRKYKGLPLK